MPGWCVQPQAAFQRGDQRCPLRALAERAGADDAEPAGDLLAADPASRLERSRWIPE